MRIEEALTQVRAIQGQVARTERYCCYRWATVAASGGVAVVAASFQAWWLPDPVQQVDSFLMLWIAVAALNVTIVGAEMLIRWVASDSEFARRQTWLTVQQFAPCLVAGALLTAALRASSPQVAALFPALWSVLFSLGIFASWRYLPHQALFAAGYYLAAGVFCARWAHGDQALLPWTMLVTFAAGQFVTSFILYWCREDQHATW